MAEILKGIGMTFKDVTLVQGTGPLDQAPDSKKPEHYDLSARISRDGRRSRTGWVSSNMMSVTGEELALALIRVGGLPVLPQFLPLEDRIHMIQKLNETD